MDRLTRLLFSVLFAAAVVMGSAVPTYAQVTPGAALIGPAGGTASTTAPSNSEGTPAGGTGVLGTTRVGPSTGVTRVSARRRHARHVRHRARRTHRAVQPASMDTNSAAGLNGSNAPSR